jgi:nitrite reductase (NADH) large subunit
MNWKDASVGKTICQCENVTKGAILRAIRGGARSLDDIRAATGACSSTHAEKISCMDCHVDVDEMLKYYGHMLDALKE